MLIFPRQALRRIATLNAEMGILLRVVLLFIMLHSTAEAKALPFRKSNGIDFVMTTALPSKRYVTVEPLLIPDETTEKLVETEVSKGTQKNSAEPLADQETFESMSDKKNTNNSFLDHKEITEAASNISLAVPGSPNTHNNIKSNSEQDLTQREEEKWELWQVGTRAVVMAAPRAVQREAKGDSGDPNTDYKLLITVVAQAFVILCGLGMVVSYKLYHSFKGDGVSTDSERSNSIDEPFMFHRRPSPAQDELDPSTDAYLHADAYLGPPREAWTPESQLSAVDSHVSVASAAATPTDRMGRLVSTMMRNDSDFVVDFRDNADACMVPSLRAISPYSSSCCHSDKILTPRTAAAGNRFIIPGAIGSEDSITTLDPAKMIGAPTATSPDHLNAANTYWERSASADHNANVIIQHYIDQELMARRLDKAVSLYQFK